MVLETSCKSLFTYLILDYSLGSRTSPSLYIGISGIGSPSTPHSNRAGGPTITDIDLSPSEFSIELGTVQNS